LAVRTLKGSIFPVLAAFLASCGVRAVPAPAETELHSTWQAQCLQDMAKSVDREVVALKAEYPPDRVDDWDVVVELNEGEALVKFMSNQKISIRGGGGEYRFSCADKSMELVQGYR
jgi:hypothetical protein